jgi:tryptophan-rich sensory protein
MFSELIKLGLLITLLMFIVPILLVVTFWCLTNLASGNIFPFLLFLIISLYLIGKR